MGRAPCCDKANVKKGPWSPEEDAQLKAYIEQHGTGGNWIALPPKIGLKRCGKSCRLRWLNYLRPNIKHGGFSVEEDDIICSLYATIGSRWSIIAAHLPGRTDNDLKNYWNTKLKKKLLEKLKNDQNRHLVAAKTKYAKVEDANKYVGTQPTAGTDQNMDMKDLYTNSCHGRVLQLFEHATCCEGSTNADRFHVNLQQVSDQEMLTPDHNFRKLIDRLEASVIDGSNSMNTIMQASSNNTCNCYDASQYSHSIIETARQFSYERAQAQAPSLECAEYLNNNVKSESPNIVGAPPPQTDNLIVFPATSSINCGSSEGNYQSAWMNTLNDEHKPNVNMGGYEFSMGLNDLLYCRNNSKCSLYPEQRQGNGGWCPFLGTMDISGLTSDIESYSGTCLNIYH